jgi:4'-phosphopantetheinyl transferase
MDASGCGIKPGHLHLWYANVQACDVMRPEDILSEEERDRVKRYRYEDDARRYLLSHYMLRTVLSRYRGREAGAIVFEPGRNGKPGLAGESPAGLRFNLAHSCDAVVVAVACGREVGVDIEALRYPAPDTGAFRAFFSPRELALIEVCEGRARADAFYRTWTRKEALLKATGEGLSGLGADLDLSTGSELWRHGIMWHVQDLRQVTGYVAAVATEGTAAAIEWKEWPGLAAGARRTEPSPPECDDAPGFSAQELARPGRAAGSSGKLSDGRI